MFTDVKKKNKKKFDVTILTKVVIGILDLWNASTYLSISQKFLPKSSNSTYRPHRPIVRKTRYINDTDLKKRKSKLCITQEI
jgi:hypothetical protein